jgi:hypothetical protein
MAKDKGSKNTFSAIARLGKLALLLASFCNSVHVLATVDGIVGILIESAIKSL